MNEEYSVMSNDKLICAGKTPEEVAYLLALNILSKSAPPENPKEREKEILTQYERCLRVVRGISYNDLG